MSGRHETQGSVTSWQTAVNTHDFQLLDHPRDREETFARQMCLQFGRALQQTGCPLVGAAPPVIASAQGDQREPRQPNNSRGLNPATKNGKTSLLLRSH